MPVRAQTAMHHVPKKKEIRHLAAEEEEFEHEEPKISAMQKLKLAGNRVIKTNRMTFVSKEDREKKQKREKADLMMYALFMFFFTLNTIDGLGNAGGYHYTRMVTSTLKLDEWAEIVTPDDLTSWFEGKFVDAVFSDNFEASGTDDGPPDFMNTDIAPTGWLIQGPVRIAQLRSNIFDCKNDMPHPLRNGFQFRCTHSREMAYFSSHFNEDKEDKATFRGFEYENPNTFSVRHQREEQSYSSYDIPESLHRFPAPAFAILIDPHESKTAAQATVKNMTANQYYDRQTNVIFIDLSVYNYMLDITQWIRLSAEFSTSGGVVCSYEIIPVQLYWTDSVYDRKFTLNVFVGIGYMYFLSLLIWKIYTDGLFTSIQGVLFWTQLINIAFYLIQLCFRYQSYSLVQHGFMSPNGIGQVDFFTTEFLDFRAPVKAMRFALTFQSINAFLNWFKLVGYLANYPVFALMTKTIVFAMDELIAFSVVFCIIMFGFAQAHCMFFGNQLYNYRTITTSFYTLFRAMLGDFDFNETYELHFIIGPLFFLMFVGIAFLVVLNIIIAIIADAYVEANEERKIDMKKRKLAKDARLQDAISQGLPVGTLGTLKSGVQNMKKVVPVGQIMDVAQSASSQAKNAYTKSGGQNIVSGIGAVISRNTSVRSIDNGGTSLSGSKTPPNLNFQNEGRLIMENIEETNHSQEHCHDGGGGVGNIELEDMLQQAYSSPKNSRTPRNTPSDPLQVINGQEASDVSEPAVLSLNSKVVSYESFAEL